MCFKLIFLGAVAFVYGGVSPVQGEIKGDELTNLTSPRMDDNPTGVLKSYLSVLRKGDAKSAWNYLVVVSGIPQSVEVHLRRKVDIQIENAKERVEPAIIEHKISGICAVVIINERPDGGSPDFDPVYMLKLDGRWRLFHSPSSFKQSSDIAPDSEPTFRNLETWYKTRKVELVRQHTANLPTQNGK